nr:uncharacterized protein LOC128673636 [Plodia interpunctella]
MFNLIIILILLFENSRNGNSINVFPLNYQSILLPPISLKEHFIIVAKYFYDRQKWKTSHLGDVIFKNYNQDVFEKKNRTYEILVWKHWDWLKKRHVYNFGRTNDSQDIFTDCSVSNCIFTGNDSTINTVDIVIVHLMKRIFPVVEKRNKKQIWVFLNDEAPTNAFQKTKSLPMLEKLANIFNWSMTYRTDSDVPVPYGRTVPLKRPKSFIITHESIAELIPYLDAGDIGRQRTQICLRITFYQFSEKHLGTSK